MTTTRIISEWLDNIEDDWMNQIADYELTVNDTVEYDTELCQFPVPMDWEIEGFADCGESATKWVWWGSDYDRAMYVCEDHYLELEKLEFERSEKHKKVGTND